MAENITELMQATANAVETVNEKKATAEETAAVAEAARQDYQTAADYLQDLRKKLNDALGLILPASDPRVRMSR